MKKRSWLLITVLMVALLSTLSVPAHAGPPENAGGHWSYQVKVNEVIKVVGGNTFVKAGTEGTWTGTFDGISDELGTVVIHSNGHLVFEGRISFASVTVDGKTGGLEMRVNGSKPNMGAEWDGKWVITGGTGELAGLRGQGIWWGPGWQGVPGVPGEIDYSGNYHFEPD